MQGYVAPLAKLAKDNDDFHRILFTCENMQLMLISLKSGEAIGSEMHSNYGQFFRIEKGKGRINMGGAKIMVRAGDAILVPAGLRHNLTNTGKKRLCLYTIFAAQHPDDGTSGSKKVGIVAEEGRKAMINEGSPV